MHYKSKSFIYREDMERKKKTLQKFKQEKIIES